MESTKWHFYLKTDDAWRSMKEACINARRTIDIEQYIIEDDAIGTEFFELFKKKNLEGVKIRILCDMAGSFSFFNSAIPKQLKELGIEVRFFHIIKPWRVGNMSSWFFRDHRKLLIVDESVGFIGGVGIRSDMQEWRDTHVKVYGNTTKEMTNAFEEMWETSIEKNIIRRIKRAIKFSKGFEFITNSPLINKRFLYKTYLEKIRGARKYILLTTPYFIPDKRFVKSLKLAVKRGVEVKLLVPAKNNHNLADIASGSHFYKLLKAGIRIFRYSGNMLHAKTAVIDDNWATVGSFNLDNLSFFFNYEANIVGTNKDFVAELKEYFTEDLKLSSELHLNVWEKRSRIRKFKEILILLIRRFL